MRINPNGNVVVVGSRGSELGDVENAMAIHVGFISEFMWDLPSGYLT